MQATRDAVLGFRTMWHRGYLAASVALGVDVKDALAALSHVDPSTHALAAELRSEKRTTRAAALTTELRRIVVAASADTIS